jgi:tRNA1(Val) A37 N6-methylase TrmN6
MKTGTSRYDSVDSTKTMMSCEMKNFIELLNKFMSGIAAFNYIHENESVNEAFEKLGNNRFGVYLYFKEIDYAWISDV